VKKLLDIKGFAIPFKRHIIDQNSKRLRTWIKKVRSLEVSAHHKYRGVEATVQRTCEANHRLTEEIARHLAFHGTNWSPDGTLARKFDNFVRATPPCGHEGNDILVVRRRITCAMLLFRGVDSWLMGLDMDERLEFLPSFLMINVPGAGHYAHHNQPDFFI